MKRCPCGTILTRSNSGRLCGTCESAEAQFRNFGERTPLIAARARHVAYCFSHPEEYPSPADYGAELTKRLDALCDCLGLACPKDLVAPWSEFLEPLVGVYAIVGEPSQNGSEKVLAP